MTHGARCPTHERAQDKARGTASQRGYGAQHRQWREQILARDPICRTCRRARSTVADHILPLKQGGTWSLTNGQGQCETCHNRKRQRESMEARGNA